MEPVALNVQEVCEALAISKPTAFDLLWSGQLRGFKIGRQWRVTREALNEYISRAQEEAPRYGDAQATANR